MTFNNLEEELDVIASLAETLNNTGVAYRVSVSIDGLEPRGTNRYDSDPNEAVETSDLRIRFKADFNWPPPEAAPKTVVDDSDYSQKRRKA